MKENLGAPDLGLAANDLDIADAIKSVKVEGDRYTEALEKTTGL